jgi:hypothetical protein
MKWLMRTLAVLWLLTVIGVIALFVWRWLCSRTEEEILLVTEVGTISRVRVAGVFSQPSRLR